jgi:hypothetical protein
MSIRARNNGRESQRSIVATGNKCFYAFAALTLSQAAYAQTPMVGWRGVAEASYTCREYPVTACKIKLYRTGLTKGPLTVSFRPRASSTATLGTDYTLKPANSVTFKADSATAEVVVTPIDDNVKEGTETVDLEIVGSPTHSYDTDGSRLGFGGVRILDHN